MNRDAVFLDLWKRLFQPFLRFYDDEINKWITENLPHVKDPFQPFLRFYTYHHPWIERPIPLTIRFNPS